MLSKFFLRLQASAILVFLVLSLGLTACVSPIAGLKPFVNASDGYRFLYPNGWIQVKLGPSADGPAVVFRDLVNETENVSVVISSVADTASLTDLGTPGEVGYLLQQKAIAPVDSGRTAELVDAQTHEEGDKTYYWLEYEVTIGDDHRHDLASVVVSRDHLYTFNVSTTEDRWRRVSKQFQTIVESFSVL